jgi:hypothetical protein
MGNQNVRTVLECTLETKEGSTTERRTAYITVSFNFGDRFKTKKLVMTLIQLKPPPIPPANAAISHVQVSQSTQQNEQNEEILSPINATPTSAATRDTTMTTTTSPSNNDNEIDFMMLLLIKSTTSHRSAEILPMLNWKQRLLLMNNVGLTTH